MAPIYIPLGQDCSLAYQLDKCGLRKFSLPFDWLYSKNLLDIIELIDNGFSNFLPQNTINTIDDLKQLYTICEIKTNNFLLNKPISTQSETFSKYKLKHKKYNIILPHEFAIIDTEQIQIFIDKYQRRIARFYQLNNSDNELIFIRLFNLIYFLF